MSSSDDNNMQIAHECYTDGEADIVVGVLRAEGIDAIVKSNHSVLPVTTGKLGRIRVYVDPADLGKAKAALESHQQSNETEPPTHPETS